MKQVLKIEQTHETRQNNIPQGPCGTKQNKVVNQAVSCLAGCRKEF